MGVPLSPGMASRKLQVYDFAWRYSERWATSPSYGEIAGALGISRQRAYQHIRSLECDGWIVRAPGSRRAMRFPRREEATPVERMMEEAFPIAPFTNTTLPIVAELEHIPDVIIRRGAKHDTNGAGDRQTRGDRSDRS